MTVSRDASDDDLIGASVKDYETNLGSTELTANVTASNVTVEQNTSFTIDVTDDFKGNVSIKVGDKVLYNNTIKTLINADKLPAGNYTATIIFYGDNNYTELTLNNIEFTVSRVTPTINVTISNITYPHDTKAIINISNNANGTVKITIDNKIFSETVSNNIVSVNLTHLSAGNKEVKVEFFSNDDYNNNTTAFTNFIIYPNILTANITVLNVTVEQNTFFIINNITDDFKGNVSIKVGDKLLYNDTVKTLINVDKLPAGNYTATIIFYGDNNYTELTPNNIEFTVSRVTSTINVTVGDVYYPAKAVAVINIGNMANGTVNVTVIDKSSGKGKVFEGKVFNGSATIDITGLSAGFKEAKVKFVSNDDYNINATAFTNFIVYPNNSNIVISDVKSNYTVDEEITVTVKTTNSTGDFNIYVNGELEKGPYSYEPGRTYEIALDGRSAGSYAIDIRLDKDENYTASATHTTVYVIKSNLTISLDDTNIPTDIVVDTPITFTANLNESVTGDVIFNINGMNYTVHVANGDNATYQYIPIDNTTLTIFATFMGDNRYNNASSTAKVFNVRRISTSVDIDFYPDIVAGDDAHITVSMNPEINGTVILH